MLENEPPSTDAALDCESAIVIRGARVHNLQNVDLDIPRDKLVVITGPSGSGKSSLVFDTLFAEGQRQYIESLSIQARQFIHQMQRPDVDLIEGLQPTISIDQRGGTRSPRSTVGTVTEIYDYLRLLMARVATPFCHQCGQPIRRQSIEEIEEQLMELPEGTRAMIIAPLVRGRKGKHEDVFQQIRKAGFVRARVDGQVVDIEQVPKLDSNRKHDIEAVIDRIVIREAARARLRESLALAANHGQGTLIVTRMLEKANPDDPPRWEDSVMSTRYACPDCQISLEEVEPRTFSFNSPYGACPSCDGLGIRQTFDPELVVPDWDLAPSDGPFAPWKKETVAGAKKTRAEIEPFLLQHKANWNTPLSQLSESARDQLLYGNGKEFLGVLVMLEKEYAIATREPVRERLETFRGDVVCVECDGARLCAAARGVRLDGHAIHEMTALSIAEAREFFAEVKIPDDRRPIADPILSEITARLDFLLKVGVDYLSLDRRAGTLSGGEMQRVRLATSIGSGLVGVCYILDEPSIGLHPCDNQRLIGAIRDLNELGNTVIVVEHDEAMMRASDQLIDVGPGAGQNGGRIIAQGTPEEVARNEMSITGEYLSRKREIPIPKSRRRISKSNRITIEGVTTNNLRDVSTHFPLKTLTCVTGVSGSGKSSLLYGTLAPAISRRLGLMACKPGPHKSLRGVSQIDKMIDIDQSPIGRTPRSNPATYCGLFDEIRKVFAGTKQAKQFGFSRSRFSFNAKGGRCEACLGYGQQKIEMNFLPDLHIPCKECDGARFNRQTLQVRYRDRSIADVLAMSVEEARTFFENFPLIHRMLRSLADVGLGYVALGQPSSTLSGGEAQRIKLAAELGRVDSGNTLYLLDEPTTGLHFEDIRRLLLMLVRLVERGNTVIVIEHNLEVIKTADWIIDLGPGGGLGGGQIVAVGSPEEIALCEKSQTGVFLKELLEKT